jgi:hypothetical protein
LSCRFEDTIIGSVRRRDVAVRSVDKWERVCETCDVWSWVGGSSNGSGPRSREEESGPWVVKCSSSVRAEGGRVRFFAYQLESESESLITINVLVYQSFDSNNTSEQVDDVAYPLVRQRRDVEV